MFLFLFFYFLLFLLFSAIAIKESAHVGDTNARRVAKGIDDLGKTWCVCMRVH